MTDENGLRNGEPDPEPVYGPPSYSPEYQHSGVLDLGSSLDLAASSDDIDLTNESMYVRASFLYLSRLPYSQWSIWDISSPDRRLIAARWLAEQFEAIDTLLRRSNP